MVWCPVHSGVEEIIFWLVMRSDLHLHLCWKSDDSFLVGLAVAAGVGCLIELGLAIAGHEGGDASKAAFCKNKKPPKFSEYSKKTERIWQVVPPSHHKVISVTKLIFFNFSDALVLVNWSVGHGETVKLYIK